MCGIRINDRSHHDRSGARARFRRFGFGWLLIAILLVLPTTVMAKDKPRIRLKMELMSIRNRSSGPLPVHVKLEYNLPQIVEGDLEMAIYDDFRSISSDDLIATLRHEGIVLAGADYEFNTVLPPLRTSVSQNWAVIAWFVTKDERIPLSSTANQFDPPVPHELLTTSPMERGTLVGSCSDNPVSRDASANRTFLESALSLDNYNPFNAEQNLSETSSGQAQVERIGKTINHFAGQWAAKDLPMDPLSYCAFDLVVLSDGALPKLTSEQHAAIITWVRAGGSLCILPDAPMKSTSLDFLRSLFEKSLDSSADLTLDSDGRLLVVSEQNDPVIFSQLGLGRAVLLPAVDDLSNRLNRKEELGSVVAFLWKVRKDQPVWNGEVWRKESLLSKLKRYGIPADEDTTGVYVTDDRYATLVKPAANGRLYVDETFTQRWGSIASHEQLSPHTEAFLSLAEQALLPSDVEMVPTWVIGLILTGYVLTIGPVDYFVLGWLRLRKYTWILFPIVTMLFTSVTVIVANAYMGSEDTGGKLTITDLGEDGIPVRQTVLETLYYSSQAEVKAQLSNEFVVQAEDSFNMADMQAMFTQNAPTAPDVPLSYAGHFPHNYSVVQRVQQWSPVSLRSLSLEPKNVKAPQIDWNDLSLVTTPDGNHRLRTTIAAEARRTATTWWVIVIHKGVATPILGNLIQDQVDAGHPLLMHRIDSRMQMVQLLLSNIPTSKSSGEGIFKLVSQLSPEGASSLEDLAFLDPTDPTQWALVIVQQDKDDIHIFRKLYLEKEPE